MDLLHTLRETLHPTSINEVWGLVGFFLWIFFTWCLHDNKSRKKTGWFKASVESLGLIIILGVIVGKIF